MSQSVDKLKALLFQPESEAIATLSKRIDSVFENAGTTERFRASVAGVIDGALRDAEVARHDQLAEAIAPVVVNTIKTEIRGSTDVLVEALYPATGRMVKAYIASAIKDLTDRINERLEQNPVVSRLAGRSAGEVAIAESQRLQVDDVFLIRRATGELVARVPEGTGGSNHDHVLGGVLTAINEFTAEAFKAEGSALRQIDLGDSRVYLRVSPAYLLAAKCHGFAPIGAEGVFDDEFLALMERLHAAERGATPGARSPEAHTALLRDLPVNLETRLGALAAVRSVPRRGIKPVYLLFGLLLTGLAAWIGWTAYSAFQVARVHEAASAVITGEPAMLGYPARITVSSDARSLTLAGLTPSLETKTRVVEQLKATLPNVVVQDQLSAVPVGLTDINPALSEFEQRLALKLENRFEASENRLRALDSRFETLESRYAELDSRFAALDRRIDALKAEIAALPRPRPPTTREELTAFARSNAVFFADSTAFNNESAAAATLKALAALLARDQDLIVRIIGYTDEIGAAASNITLADTRAATVASKLEALGVNKTQLVTLHRTSPEYNLSSRKGTGSPNRRVEFEVGFVGESRP